MSEDKPHTNPWFTSSEVTLTSVVTKGSYGSYKGHDLKGFLGYPSTWGTIVNHGNGNLYIAWLTEEGIKVEETKILPGGTFEWKAEWNYEVWGIFVRTDVANTIYQVEAG